MNKKLKKKRIPECNDAYKNALIKKVLDADVVYEWEHVLIDKHRWLSCIPGIFLGVVFAFLTKDFWAIVGVTVFVIIMNVFMYFLCCASRDYLCQITPFGIRSYETERVPEVFYKATRGFAYVGIVVCVIAVIFVGPMAFVGAGGSALMAFQMRNFHKKTESRIMPFEDVFDYQFYGSESMFRNDLFHYRYSVPEFFSEENDNLDELREFHWLTAYCKQEQHKEIHAVMTRYINAKSRQIEQESAVTE